MNQFTEIQCIRWIVIDFNIICSSSPAIWRLKLSFSKSVQLRRVIQQIPVCGWPAPLVSETITTDRKCVNIHEKILSACSISQSALYSPSQYITNSFYSNEFEKKSFLLGASQLFFNIYFCFKWIIYLNMLRVTSQILRNQKSLVGINASRYGINIIKSKFNILHWKLSSVSINTYIEYFCKKLHRPNCFAYRSISYLVS